MIQSLAKETWEQRALFRKKTRDFFEGRGYLEVETPHLLLNPSLEPHLDPYPVELEDGRKAFLNTSPEVNLKKLLGSSGLKKIFELAHSYRGGERGANHRSEFIMLEWYAKDYRLFDLMDETSEFMKVFFSDLPQHRITLEDWFKEKIGIGLAHQEMVEVLRKREVEGVDSMDFGECFFRLFLPTETDLESMGIVFLSGYPEELSSYSKVQDGCSQRFEVYLNGVEVGNAYEERTSKEEMLAQLQKEKKEREALGKPPLKVDEVFASALDHIKEPVSGIAMGWDRLFAAWAGSSDLEGTCPYPNWTERED